MTEVACCGETSNERPSSSPKKEARLNRSDKCVSGREVPRWLAAIISSIAAYPGTLAGCGKSLLRLFRTEHSHALMGYKSARAGAVEEAGLSFGNAAARLGRRSRRS